MPNPRLCRICLLEQKSNQGMLHLLNDNELVQKIEEVGGIKLKIHDNFPRMLCVECANMLDTSYKFRNLCKASESVFVDFIIRTELQSEPKASVQEAAEGEVFFAEFIDSHGVENFPEIKEEFEPYGDGFIRFDNDNDQRIEYLLPDDDKRCYVSEKRFKSEIRGTTFSCSSEIRRHTRTHTREKPYKCKFCERAFANRSTYIKHERTHTNERPFSCNTCGKSFNYPSVFKSHMLSHTGEKLFSCNYCKKSFSRKHQLKQHYSTIIHQQTVENISH